MDNAINLAQSQMANKKQLTPGEKLDQIQIPSDILPEEKRPEGVYNIIFKLAKKKKGRTYLDNCGDPVPNPKNGNRPERIWLLAGASSIWESDVENILKDKARYERARRGMDIVFIDGVCRVRSADVLRLEFMRANAKNIGKNRGGAGPFDYYEYNPAQEQKERMAKQILKIEIILKLKELSEEKVKKLASFFAIPFVDELGMPISPDGLRTELMLKADTDPATVQKHIDSKEVEVSYLVKRAIIDNKIDLGGESRNAVWANGQGHIAKIPALKKPYEYLTELAMTNSDEGRKFKEQLEQIVK
jgi:hypothetical protein